MPLFGAYGIGAERDLYRATSAVTRALVFAVSPRIASAAVSRRVQQGVERTFSNPGSTGMELAIYIQCRKTREQ